MTCGLLNFGFPLMKIVDPRVVPEGMERRIDGREWAGPLSKR